MLEHAYGPAAAQPSAAGLDMASIGPGLYTPVLCLVDYRVASGAPVPVTHHHGVRLGCVDVFRYDGIGRHQGRRYRHHIREDGISDYLVTIPLDARIEFEQAGSAGAFEPGSFVLLSTASPFDGVVAGAGPGGAFSALHLRVTGAQLRQRVPDIDRYCDHPLRLAPGMGTIMRTMCELAIVEGHTLSPEQTGHLASMLADAVANATLAAPEYQEIRRQTPPSSLDRVRRQALAYIDVHFTNPALDTEAVAQHCRVSKRYLQAAFAAHGETLNAMIRESRLQHCRKRLRAAGSSTLSVTRVAIEAGFNDLPYFCRAYRARFGVSPGADRQPLS